jgi:nucleoside 2-deoxyribosyltransferase
MSGMADEANLWDQIEREQWEEEHQEAQGVENPLKVYIAGLISNGGRIPLLVQKTNAKVFDKAETRLRLAGYEPVNPLKLNPVGDGKTWQEVMKIDLRAMLDCDAVYALDGWEYGKGSAIEVGLAQNLGMPIYLEGTL